MNRSLVVAVAQIEPSDVAGTFMRHQAMSRRGLSGSSGGGRWGRPGAYSVLYLGQPESAIIAEAYKLLVDPVEGMTAESVKQRRYLTCSVDVANIIDLRDANDQVAVGLNPPAITGPHGPCQSVGEAAHQLGAAGILAPCAAGVPGETLALFLENLPPDRFPTLLSADVWLALPPDPRRGPPVP